MARKRQLKMAKAGGENASAAAWQWLALNIEMTARKAAQLAAVAMMSGGSRVEASFPFFDIFSRNNIEP